MKDLLVQVLRSSGHPIVLAHRIWLSARDVGRQLPMGYTNVRDYVEGKQAAVSRLAGGVGEATQRVGDAAGQAVGQVGQTANQAVGQVSDQAGRLLEETVNEAGETVQRVVDESGVIVERTRNDSGEVLDEAVVGDASDAGSEEENANGGVE
jgi:hypothetical protein